MSNPVIQFRMEESMRNKAAAICRRLGMSLTSYYKMCTSRLIEENGVPFSMKINDSVMQDGLEALYEAGRIAEKRGTANMSLEEINAIIADVRNEETK